MAISFMSKKRLIASVFSAEDAKASPATNFLTETEHSLQVGLLKRSAEELIPRHHHVAKSNVVMGCQEILIVRKGNIRVDIFGTENEYVGSTVLKEGSIFIQYLGGHEFYFITDSEIVEVKQGPYSPSDKVYFNPLDHEQSK